MLDLGIVREVSVTTTSGLPLMLVSLANLVNASAQSCVVAYSVFCASSNGIACSIRPVFTNLQSESVMSACGLGRVTVSPGTDSVDSDPVSVLGSSQ